MLIEYARNVITHLHQKVLAWRPQRSPAPTMQRPYSLLTDTGTGAILATSPFPSIIVFLNEAMRDTNHIARVWSSEFENGAPFPPFGEESLARWSWNVKACVFVPTREDVLTEEIRARSRLARAKQDAIGRIILHTNIARNPLKTGLEFQETVYLEKKFQAEAFKETGYREARLFEFPYVLEYADLANLSPREAADDIILKGKLANDILVKTETLRLAYFRRVKAAPDREAVTRVFEEFNRDCYTNARV